MNEHQIQEIAATFPYPPTPDIATTVRHKLATPTKQPRWHVSRRLAWAVVVLLLVLAGSLAVPQVRAAVLRIFRAGAITIFVPEATAVPPTATAPAQLFVPQTTATPGSLTAQVALMSPAGEITLAELQAQTTFPLYIPEGWGPPDRVNYQTQDWPSVVIFVWLEPDNADKARLSLYQINARDFAYKGADRVEETAVNGEPAFWIEGEHWLQMQDGTMQPWLFVEGSVLVWWSETGTTFRLESGLSLAEAKEIAESLVLLPEKE